VNHKTFPKGYRRIGTLDFVRNRKQLLIVGWSGIIITVVMVLLGLIFYPIAPSWAFLKANWWAWLALAGMNVSYILLHELIHGVLMHALSGVKPTYGLKLPYAYAGSKVYFDKKSHGLIALAPLIVCGIALFVLERTLPAGWFWLLYTVQISNVSGSVGDVYCVLHLNKLPGDILIQDTGTRMTIFAPRPENEEQK